MADILHAVDDNRIIEMFGTGTACIVSPIKSTGYKGKQFKFHFDALKLILRLVL